MSTLSIPSTLRLWRVALLGLVPVAAFANANTNANTFNFSTTGLRSMAHGTAYTWGLSPTANTAGTELGALEKTIGSGGKVKSATLTINGLYDWIAEPADVLYINILDNVKAGVSSFKHTANSPGYDTVFGKDIFNVVEKPAALVAPVAPTKPTIKKPSAPKAPTLTLPVAPTPPAALGANPTATQIKNYNSAVTSYNTKFATYQSKLAAYAAAQTKYAADVVTYNTDLAAYDAVQAKYVSDKSAYDAALVTYKAELPAYKAKLAEYTRYTNNQAALGFTGVPLIGTGDSIYDQEHSLLRADEPNGPGTWTDLDGPATKTNLVITFSQANLDLLQYLLENATASSHFGLGFGPECHFYDKDINLQITTVPEAGATLLLLGFGMAGLAGTRRFAKKKL